jgi:predicted esterase
MTQAAAQTPPERRLMQSNVRPEQLPGTIRRAVAQLKPEPAVVAEIDRLVALGEASYTAGNMGETRRYLFHALALTVGRVWTARDDYWRSLVLRTDMAVFDPARPLIVRLEQIYPSDYQARVPLSIRAMLHPAGAAESDPPLRELGLFTAFSPDFRDRPFPFSADLGDVQVGRYQVTVEVLEGDEFLRRLSTPVWLVRGLDATRAAIEERLEAVSGHESTKASVRAPFDFVRRVNLDRTELGNFDVAAEIEASERLLAEIEEGTDPLAGAVGNHKRHYFFEQAGEIMPYRINVPAGYDGSRAFPLIVLLHGNGGTEDTMMDAMGGLFPKETEKRGYIGVTPMGYRRSGGYGRARAREVVFSAERQQIARLSAIDVINVIDQVRAEYRIDDDRIYLMGVSMGGGGTWTLGAMHPEMWAAISPISAGVIPDEIDWERITDLPVLVCHGDQDATVPVEFSRQMVARMKALGMTYEHLELADAGHRIFPRPLAAALDFFDHHARGSASQ